MTERVLGTLLLLATTVSLPACAMPLQYVIEPMEARIVDAETKQPIEGVVVVAHWELEHGTVGGNVPSGQLKVMESVTNKDGRFAFSGFGPETVWDSFLVNKDPELIIFKSGYEYRRLLNRYISDRELRTRRERRSDWNGKIVELKLFKGMMEEYARRLTSLEISLGFAYRGDNCEWKSAPRMVASLFKEEVILSQKRISNSLSKITSLPRQEQCGEAQEVLREFLK